MPKGGTACSIVLTVLEVMRACNERYVNEELVYNLHVALLYQYAKQKVKQLCYQTYSYTIDISSNKITKSKITF